MRLVRENANTEYGRKNNFKDIRNMDEFRRYVPLTTYDDYTPYLADRGYVEITKEFYDQKTLEQLEKYSQETSEFEEV